MAALYNQLGELARFDVHDKLQLHLAPTPCLQLAPHALSRTSFWRTKRADALRQGATEDELLDPEAVLGVSPAGLRACGLSERKASYILDLAGRFASGALSTERITRMDDAALFAELSAIKGIGVPAGPRCACVRRAGGCGHALWHAGQSAWHCRGENGVK